MNTVSNGKTANMSTSGQGSSIGNTSEKFEKYVDQVASSAHKNIDKLSGAAYPAIDHATSTAHSVIDAASDAAAQTVDTVVNKVSLLKEVEEKALENLRLHVRDSPLVAVGISAAVGYGLAYMFRNRR